MNNLQVEEGNFTRIVNPLIDNLIKIPFKGCELAVAMYIIRKTYGYNKTQDEISLSQFCKGVNRSRQTIVTALKNLQLVNIPRLVKRKGSTSLGTFTATSLGTKTHKRKKDNTKDNTPVTPKGVVKSSTKRKHNTPCPIGSENHNRCIKFLGELARMKNLKGNWLNYGKQLGFLHKMLRAKYDFTEIKQVAESLENDNFMWNKWDVGTITSKIERQGREVVVDEKTR